MSCKHNRAHVAQCDVNHFEDTGSFLLDVRIQCQDCGRPFVFVGLPAGLNLAGAAVSVDGKEAHLAIAPEGTAPTTLDLIGFAIHVGKPQ